MELSQAAKILNDDIASASNRAFDFLSEKGKKIYFPFKGILGQSAEASSAKLNATIGTAFEEDGFPLSLDCIKVQINVPPESLLYAPSFGILKLREIWKEQIYKKNPSLKNTTISMPVVTSALTHGLYVSGYLFVDEGDEIILSDFSWDNYELIFQNNFGAKFSRYQTFLNNKYNVEGIVSAIKNSKSGKKIVLLNFPNNPTGYTVTEEEAFAIRDNFLNLAKSGEKIVVILDDAYFGLIYEDFVFKESLFSLLADLHENILVVKLDASTKEDYVWGFRIGFITFGIKGANEKELKALEAKAAGVVRSTVSNCSSVAQSMLINAYKNSSYIKQKSEKFETLKNRYLKIKQILKAHPEYSENFISMPFNSGYFMCVKPIGVEAEDLRRELISNFETGTIALSGLLRIAFSSVPIEALERIFENINNAVKKISTTPRA